jgi:hypothetical protein
MPSPAPSVPSVESATLEVPEVSRSPDGHVVLRSVFGCCGWRTCDNEKFDGFPVCLTGEDGRIELGCGDFKFEESGLVIVIPIRQGLKSRSAPCGNS